MAINVNPITITYSDERLRTLVEEYITMQKHEFTFKDLCSYVLYWAKEEGKTTKTGLYESDQLDLVDRKRISIILKKNIIERRISNSTEIEHDGFFGDDSIFQKVSD